MLWLSGGYLRIIGANSLAQLNWLSIQLFRILQVFSPCKLVFGQELHLPIDIMVGTAGQCMPAA